MPMCQLALQGHLEKPWLCLQGDRRAGTAGPSLSEFNFESQWGQKALKHMYRAICEVRLTIPHSSLTAVRQLGSITNPGACSCSEA